MEVDQCFQVIPEDLRLILKSGAVEIPDKNISFNAIEQCRILWDKLKMEENLMAILMPCVRNLFIQIYDENCRIISKEQSQELAENLMIAISLTDFIGNILDQVSSNSEYINNTTNRSMFVELPSCFHLTYKHCKESQQKCQSLIEDSTQILELYKKNQDNYKKFLNIFNTMDVENNTNSAEIVLQVSQCISNIIEIVFGMNIKALADSWKGYCNIVEKYHSILANEKFYCVQEIQILMQQICSFMDDALDKKDDKQTMHYIKLSGFLLKVAIKIISKLWDHLQIHYLEVIHKFLCTVYDYSLEFLGKWSLKIDVQHCIQTSLFGVITPFLTENIFCENFLKHSLLNFVEAKHRTCGCVIIDLKILKYLYCQPSNTVDYISFSDFLNHIFEDVDLHFSTLYDYPGKTESFLFDNICSTISQCIVHHSDFYNGALEHILIENILGNSFWCHFLASELWIRILQVATKKSRQDVVLGFIETIDIMAIDISFNSMKLLLLNRFMQRLFSILGDDEITSILSTYPPQDHLDLWRTIGFNNVSIKQKNLMDPLFNMLSTKMEKIETYTSGSEVLNTLETLRLISTMDISIIGSNNERLISSMLQFWEFNYEEVKKDNNFLKSFISRLCEATQGFITCLSNDQICCILKKMKMLTTTLFFKLQSCCLLKAISSRTTEHTMEQNALNFIISDLFEILLTENNNVVKELSLEIFKQFAHHNHYIIVNNVSRMLPSMNLENFLNKNSDNTDVCIYLKTLQITNLEHKCIKGTSAEVESLISQTNLFKNNSFIEEAPKVLTTKFNRALQTKRIKLTENIQEDDDTIGEVLQRIKSEIKCLNKILLKDRLTPKNAQDIKILVCQLQSTLGSN